MTHGLCRSFEVGVLAFIEPGVRLTGVTIAINYCRRFCFQTSGALLETPLFSSRTMRTPIRSWNGEFSRAPNAALHWSDPLVSKQPTSKSGWLQGLGTRILCKKGSARSWYTIWTNWSDAWLQFGPCSRRSSTRPSTSGANGCVPVWTLMEDILSTCSN